MGITLSEILTLVGRLDDSPGFDSPRERFRRFVTERVTDVADVRALIVQCQQRLDDQHARARQDLIAMLGRFLGFEVTFGAYGTGPDPAGFPGHWRSRRRARIVIDVRSEQTGSVDAEALSRRLAVLAAQAPTDDEERWVGLCITTPFYAARHHLECLLDHRAIGDIRCVTVESLLWLAETMSGDRLAHADVLRLLASGPDSEFMIDLMRRFASTSNVQTALAAVVDRAAPESRESKPGAERPILSIVPDRERETRFWLAGLSDDETATPGQLLDAVVHGRRLLGITDTLPAAAQVQPGDRVCFLIEDRGIVGHAQMDGAVSDPATVIRSAHRFSFVFRLNDVTIYDVPNPVTVEAARRIVDRIPFQTAPSFLAPLSRADYETLTTAGMVGHTRAAIS